VRKLTDAAGPATPSIVRDALSRLLGRREPAPLILLYHSIAEVESDPWSLSVSPAHFAEHLDVITSSHRPLPLSELVRLSADGRAPPDAVALTIDDGYANNLLAAKPLLERAGVPATVFIATGMLGGSEFWWDEIARIVLGTSGGSPLRLRFPDGEREWPVEESLDADAMRVHRAWRASRDAPTTMRQRAFLELYRLMRALTPNERATVLAELGAWSGAPSVAAPLRSLTEAELAELARGALVEIGAHTVSHPVLATLPFDAQRKEMVESRARLFDLLDRSVTSLAYPFGGRKEYSADSVAIARELGFDLACANVHGALRPTADRLELPRVMIRDWSGEELERRLRVYARD
jgi:peptidoglycan/xylan/chitin deacetylase (PgdA/CDA1 family)